MTNKNLILTLLFFVIVLFFQCRTSEPRRVKIIEERDPVVKTIEEKDSMRIVTDSIKNVQRKK